MENITFKNATTEKRLLLLAFFKEKGLTGVQFTLKKDGEQYLNEKYPKDDTVQLFKLRPTGSIEKISDDGMLSIEPFLSHDGEDNQTPWYQRSNRAFTIPVELIDDITIIYDFR